MKIRNLLIILLTMVLAWLLPTLFHMFSAKPSGRLFVYYSSVTGHFCTIDKNAKTDEIERKDIETEKRYSLNEFDSILPLLYYRQLLADGRMPDTLQGKAISAKEANEKSFFFRYKPTQKNSPAIALYPLFESASGRVDLKMPDDVFRLGKEFAFLDPETNSVDAAKTAKFKKAFVAAGFTFPAKKVAGNPSPRKPYDEGYFVTDANDKLYHFKMVKANPFLKEVRLPKDCKPVFFAPFEPDDRSFYGFLFSERGEVYIINTSSYTLQKLDCGRVDLDKNFLVIMGNPLYWTVRVIAQQKEAVFAFTAQDKKQVAYHEFIDEDNKNHWNTYIFPFELKWTDPLSKYVQPLWKWGNYAAFIVNVFLVIFFLLLGANRKQSARTKIFPALWVLFTGIFGLLSIWTLKEKN